MLSSQPFPARPLPRGLLVIGSTGILVHLAALAVLVIAAPSGPWVMPGTGIPSPAEPPQFIEELGEFTSRYYLQPLHFTSNYHFASNNLEVPHIYFEVRLKDKDGRPINDDRGNPMVFKFPDDNANFWVRHRQSLLAQGLGGDQPIPLPQSVRIPSPLVRVWFGPPKGEWRLEQKEERELQKRRAEEWMMMFSRPSDWSLLLAKSYARHVCSKYRAAKAEIVRFSREPISPVVLVPGVTADSEFIQRSFETFICNFGE